MASVDVAPSVHRVASVHLGRWALARARAVHRSGPDTATAPCETGPSCGERAEWAPAATTGSADRPAMVAASIVVVPQAAQRDRASARSTAKEIGEGPAAALASRGPMAIDITFCSTTSLASWLNRGAARPVRARGPRPLSARPGGNRASRPEGLDDPAGPRGCRRAHTYSAESRTALVGPSLDDRLGDAAAVADRVAVLEHRRVDQRERTAALNRADQWS